MESPTQGGLRRTVSLTSTPPTSRRSSAVRSRPRVLHKYASSSSLRQASTPLASDEQSLTSFPSLSPSLENSPDPFDEHTSKTEPIPSVEETIYESPPAIAPSFEELFSTTTASNERSALFDDASKHDVRDLPGTLHHSSDEHVKHLIARTGAVALVKQLSQDLAQRDAQVTLLQRRAEERESLLRKMLRECEVSNLDIENRLRDLVRSKDERDASGNDRAPNKRRTNDVGTRPGDSISERMLEALDDSLDHEEVDALGIVQQAPRFDRKTSGTGRVSRDSSVQRAEVASVRSGQSGYSQKSSTTRGWKGLFGYGTSKATGKSASIGEAGPGQQQLAANGGLPRSHAERTLGDELFRPPTPATNSTISNTASLQDQSSGTRARDSNPGGPDVAQSSKSVASWALRLVAGSSQPTPELDSHARDRAATFGAGMGRNTDFTRASPLIRSKSRTNVNITLVNAYSRSSTFGPHGTIKRPALDAGRNPVSGMLEPSPREPIDGLDTNLGPVEMDTILPEETRPPTLVQYNNYGPSIDFLTDRFGFIYDQRRRRRQNEAAAALPGTRGSHVESLRNHRRSVDAAQQKEADMVSIDSRISQARSVSRPITPASMEEAGEDQAPKRWQDYLRLSTFATELLSHTPSTAPITDITTGEPEGLSKVSQIHVSKRGSLPTLSINPAPSETRVVSEHAELARPSTHESTSVMFPDQPPLDPVKSLLDQVNEVHDALQRDKTVKWNEFLRKVRAERKRDGEQSMGNGGRSKAAAMPEVFLSDGEIIGVAGLGNKGKLGRAKGSEFRNLVLGGIPVSYRAKIWAECSGALALRVPGYYEELANSSFDDATIVQQIQMDITRTLTDNIFFRKGQGVQKLKEVLLAYARRNPEIGYCQGMNLITANLLLIMPAAEDAFWVLTCIVETILPPKYYDSSLLTSRADQVVLRQYVVEVLPQLSAHLEMLGIDLEAVTFQWFLSVFTDCLTAEALFRVWDVVLCLNDGATFLFQVALALLKLNEQSLLRCETPAEVYGYINQRMTDPAISIDGLIRASEGLKKEVKRDDVVERRRLAVEAEQETARQREMIRKGKARAIEVEQPQPVVNSNLRVVDEISRSKGGRLSRQNSRTRFDFDEDEYEDYGGELQVRTPMPIDEEALWRA